MDEQRCEDEPYPGTRPGEGGIPTGPPAGGDPDGLREAAPATRVRAAFPGSDWLVADSPREILHRLLDGDPFQLADRSRRRLRQKALFLNPERLYFKSIARVAYAALDYEGRPPLDPWLESCIDRALADMGTEQYEEELRTLPPEESDDGPFYAAFADRTGIEVGLARLACLTLNDLPEQARLAFQAVGMEGKTVHRYVAEGHGPPDRVRRHLRQAALSVLLALDGRPPEAPGAPDA